jgi:hypothetical protein
MAYGLTLTKSERKAINWIGHRYRHGDEFRRLLMECSSTPDDADWDDERDIKYTIPEHIAWAMAEIIDEGLDCFSDEFCDKLLAFRYNIV